MKGCEGLWRVDGQDQKGRRVVRGAKKILRIVSSFLSFHYFFVFFVSSSQLFLTISLLLLVIILLGQGGELACPKVTHEFICIDVVLHNFDFEILVVGDRCDSCNKS